MLSLYHCLFVLGNFPPYLVSSGVFAYVFALWQAYEQGTCFAKWRNLLQLDPTELGIAHTMGSLCFHLSE